jgi:hypothetical protein
MANGSMNEIGLNHGAIGSIGSLTSVSFTGSGWWWNLWVHLVTHEDFTIGEASTYSNARVSTVYTPPGATTGVDESLQYVLYGDPMVHFVSPGDLPPVPLPRHLSYGQHFPDGYAEGIGTGSQNGGALVTIDRNPAGSSAVVTLNGTGQSGLSIFDLTGRLVSTPFQGNLDGSMTMTLDTGGMSPGVYFLRLENGGEVSTSSMVVIR